MPDNDLETIIKSIMNMKKGTKSQAGLSGLGSALTSEDCIQMMSSLSDSGKEAVKQAAQYAISGDRERAKITIMTLLQTQEGAALLKKILSSLSK